MNPIDNLRDRIASCVSVSNVTIVGRDGTFPTHKVIFAGVSDFITDLILPIPSSDDVTIFLPDFQIDHVSSLIDQVNFEGSNQSLVNEDLLLALKCSPKEEPDLDDKMLISTKNFDSNNGNEDSKLLYAERRDISDSTVTTNDDPLLTESNEDLSASEYSMTAN